MGGSWRRKLAVRVAAVAVGAVGALLLLVAVDRLLGVSGIDLGPPAPDPFAGFSRTQSKFVRKRVAGGREIYQTRPVRRRKRQGALPEPPRTFEAEKKPQTFRIFVLGGSSAAGTPYGTAYAFGEWLQLRLHQLAPNLEWDVVNAAFSGYSTRRILVLVDEIVNYQPDLVILYSGHNEFAEQRFYRHLLRRDPRLFRLQEAVARTNLYRWWSSTNAAPKPVTPSFAIDDQNRSFEMFAVMAERAGGSAYPTSRQRAYGALLFEHNLRAIVDRLRESDVAAMLLTLSQNFSDWEPGASSHDSALEDAAIETWRDHFAAGERMKDQDCRTALQHYSAALEIDDQHALLHFRIASCRRALADHETARTHYERASDLDRVPQGAPLHFNRIIRDVATTQDVALLDVEVLLRTAADNGLVGSNFFTDFVHPNIEAHQRIALALADEIRRRDFAANARWTDVSPVFAPPRELLTRFPQLRVAEHLAMSLACALSMRRDCVRRSAMAAMALDPDNRAAREFLDMLKGSSLWDFDADRGASK